MESAVPSFDVQIKEFWLKLPDDKHDLLKQTGPLDLRQFKGKNIDIQAVVEVTNRNDQSYYIDGALKVQRLSPGDGSWIVEVKDQQRPEIPPQKTELISLQILDFRVRVEGEIVDGKNKRYFQLRIAWDVHTVKEQLVEWFT